MPNLDLWPLLEKLPIKTKEAKIIYLNRNDPFAWAQREFVSEVERQYNAGLPVRILVLKGRQLGISTITEAILFIWSFLHPGSNQLVLCKEKPDSEYLFGMFKRFWEEGPFKGLFPTKYNRVGYIEWDVIGSSVMTETAKKADVGRSRTILGVHGSEVAFWQEADQIVPALGEAVPFEHGSIIILESTAQGVGGYFHDEWMKSTDPTGHRSDFMPMFFPWWEHDEYEVKNHNLTYRELDDDERELLTLYPKMNLAKLAWRRRKMQTYANPETFKEEYPNNPDEAFLSTGTNVFPLQKLVSCYEPDIEREQGFLYNNNGRLDWMDTDDGHTFVYKRPDPRQTRRYVVAVDPTWTPTGDPACIQVLDRASMEQVAVWHGSADSRTVGEISLALAMWYGPSTILNTEVQGGGRAVLEVWRNANWPYIWLDQRPDRPRRQMNSLGWNSTFETKNWLIETVKGILHRRSCLIHHPATYYEMTRFVNNEDGTFGPSRRSGHDDCVISFGIAVMTIVTSTETMDWKAMAAPLPPHIPGVTPPRLANGYRPIEPMVLAGFRGMDAFTNNAELGVEEVY